MWIHNACSWDTHVLQEWCETATKVTHQRPSHWFSEINSNTKHSSIFSPSYTSVCSTPRARRWCQKHSSYNSRVCRSVRHHRKNIQCDRPPDDLNQRLTSCGRGGGPGVEAKPTTCPWAEGVGIYCMSNNAMLLICTAEMLTIIWCDLS